jgi:hypothetical protein
MRLVLLFISLVALVACGGGGGDATKTEFKTLPSKLTTAEGN